MKMADTRRDTTKLAETNMKAGIYPSSSINVRFLN